MRLPRFRVGTLMIAVVYIAAAIGILKTIVAYRIAVLKAPYVGGLDTRVSRS